MKRRTFLESLNDAAEGFLYAVHHERNMRVHFLFSFLVLLLAILLGVSRTEWVVLCTAIALVLVTEMINTTVEEIVDAVFKGSHSSQARTIKHISAGVVLVSACSALAVGLLIFSNYWAWPFEHMALRLRYASWHIIIFSLLMVLFAVIVGKAIFQRGTPFRGGAISGHAAAAFSLWTAVLFSSTDFFVIGTSFCLAVLVAQSRLREKIHSLMEVVAGAAVGIFVTALFFKIFS